MSGYLNKLFRITIINDNNGYTDVKWKMTFYTLFTQLACFTWTNSVFRPAVKIGTTHKQFLVIKNNFVVKASGVVGSTSLT